MRTLKNLSVIISLLILFVPNKLFAQGDKLHFDNVVKNPNGSSIDLSNIVKCHKYTLIDFWASWCVPCRAQGLELKSIYSKFNKLGFEVIGFSTDTKKIAWYNAINTDQLPWLQASDLMGMKSAFVKSYGVLTIPQTFLLDSKGKVVDTNLHGRALEEKLIELLKIKQ